MNRTRTSFNSRYKTKTRNRTKNQPSLNAQILKSLMESKSRKNSKNMNRRILEIPIPNWVTITDYRTMTNKKKDDAVAGDKTIQLEWMIEEINEFYEAIHLQDIGEIRDEAIGLIRTFQQFQDSKKVVALWNKVRNDVVLVFPTRKSFVEAFDKWHKKKLIKKQAIGVLPEHLIDIAKLNW